MWGRVRVLITMDHPLESSAARLLAMDSLAEYEKLVRCSPMLRIAFQEQLTSLTEDLVADGMISIDNKTEILNQTTTLPHRAVKFGRSRHK